MTAEVSCMRRTLASIVKRINGRPTRGMDGTSRLAVSKLHRNDNSLAESVIGLYKTEVIWRQGPWKRLDDVEFATLDWVCWYNEKRLPEPIGDIPRVEFE